MRSEWGSETSTPSIFANASTHSRFMKRFMSFVRVSDGCWEWTGRGDARGYGSFCIGRDRKAHRVAFEAANGLSLKQSVAVLHSCDNRRCVRPDHLSTGTKADNTNDMMQKGLKAFTSRTCEMHPRSKVSDAADQEIVGLVAAGVRTKEIAIRYGVSQTTIQKIANGKRWAIGSVTLIRGNAYASTEVRHVQA